MLFRKKIILAVTGSIAAYKSALLTRLLVKAGAEVRIVMSDAAKDFITPLTLSTLSKNPVHSSFTIGSQGEWVNHVELGLWADAMVVAPASANMIASCGNGNCNNLLSAVYLSARCPVFFSPAMDLDMWKHPSTQKNIAALRSYGNFIIEPVSGELASGLVGEGRMTEPEDIVRHLEVFFNLSKQMHGKQILITAGPTREMIDPVRYISNHSSGKMGYALAEELAQRGANVTLISGPVAISAKHPNIDVVKVITAQEMLEAATKFFSHADAAILTAAVADFKPKNASTLKIKKSGADLNIELETTTDILHSLAAAKRNDQFVGGFALETNDGRTNAEIKVKNKSLDFIVLNELSQENQVFGNDFNTIEIFGQQSGWISFEKQTKAEAAKEIANYLDQLFNHA